MTGEQQQKLWYGLKEFRKALELTDSCAATTLSRSSCVFKSFSCRKGVSSLAAKLAGD